MAFKTSDVHALVASKTTELWQSAMAFSILYQMQGEDKPAKPLKEVYQLAFNAAKAANPALGEDALASMAKADTKTVSDAIRGVWPYAATFYGNASIDRKRELSDMTAATARDALVKDIRKHMEVLGKSGRSAYFAVIRFASKEAMDEELALQEANAAKAALEAAASEPVAELPAAEPENTAIAEPVKTDADVIGQIMNLASTLADAELATLMAKLNAYAIERAETIALLQAQEERIAA